MTAGSTGLPGSLGLPGSPTVSPLGSPTDSPAPRLAADTYAIASVDKAVQLLLAMAQWPPERTAGVSELARQLGLTKTQVYRLLRTLERHDLVVQEPGERRYRLGPTLLALGEAARERIGLVRAARPVMDRLAAETGESVHLVERHQRLAVVVDLRDSAQRVRLTARVGGRYPLHAGACPQAILAYLPAHQQEQVLAQLASLPRYTPRTVLDPARLRRILDDVRERGYAFSDEDVDPGARAVGAPIFGPSGEPVGAISVAGPSFRLPDALVPRYGALVRQAAAEVTARFGGVVPPAFERAAAADGPHHGERPS
ncbi:IclR family transcriptional regulator [Geochorda subterranea]|uniref:IclR family transcriptional regulator n=1 Tax=Geochorda subterranea TaxID=3109564 RepID=A0ABZ1BMV0_9FIRM|nr:IclR family transcriptional regulator [Limnochorda sp. LNt]WRP13828.1 IclR family transcriptional regulator [Limnochorda sp. LNt]